MHLTPNKCNRKISLLLGIYVAHVMLNYHIGQVSIWGCQDPFMHSKLHELNHSLIQNFLARPECHRNWPTAHALLSSNKDRLYRNLNPGPRYGWHCTFTVDYGLPLEDFLFQSEDGRLYINLTFGVPLLDTVVNDFTTTVSVASSNLII
jgi:hypothetical protein